jgi:transmembrane sensor
MEQDTSSIPDPESDLTPEMQARLAEASRALELTGGPRFRQAVDLDGAWATFAAKANGTAGTWGEVPPRPAVNIAKWHRPYAKWRAPVLAAVAVLCALVAVSYRGRLTESTSAQHVYTTISGQRTTVQLADGSRVTLAPETQLAVPVTFGQSTRAVTLVGEAYFDVKNADGAPFIVRTGTVVTRVLGTMFDVKRYARDTAVRVVVTSGKVQAAAERGRTTHPVTLTSGMIGHVSDSIATVTTVANPSAYTSWTQGRLDFRGVSVAEMLPELERWYGVRFALSDSSLSAVRVSASFDFDQTADALDFLKSLLSVRMTFDRHGDTTVVTLHPQTAPTTPSANRRDGSNILKPRTEVGR